MSSLDDEDAISEERRLCYVGITRARRRVNLTLARQRALYGDLKMNPPSRFLAELPERLVEGASQLSAAVPEPRWSPAFSTQPPQRKPAPRGEYVVRDEYSQDWSDARLPAPKAPRASASSGSSVTGRRVRHKSFGSGRVISSMGTGESAKFTVDFPGVGPKVVLGRFLDPED